MKIEVVMALNALKNNSISTKKDILNLKGYFFERLEYNDMVIFDFSGIGVTNYECLSELFEGIVKIMTLREFLLRVKVKGCSEDAIQAINASIVSTHKKHIV